MDQPRAMQSDCAWPSFCLKFGFAASSRKTHPRTGLLTGRPREGGGVTPAYEIVCSFCRESLGRGGDRLPETSSARSTHEILSDSFFAPVLAVRRQDFHKPTIFAGPTTGTYWIR